MRCLLLALLGLLVLLGPRPAVAGPPMTAADENVGPVSLWMPAAEVRKALGPPASRGTWVTEAASGQQVQEWRYPARGLTITMSRASEEEAAQVDRFRVRAPSRDATSRGIRIGDPAEKVRKAYAGLLSSESTSSSLVVGSVYDGVIFTLERGRVTEIFVGAAAE